MNYKPLKAKIKGVLEGHTVVMVTYYVTKTITRSPMVGQFFDTMIAASSDNAI